MKLKIRIYSPSPQTCTRTHTHMYTHTQYFDLAADVLAENTHLTYKCLSPYLYDFIDAKITQQTSAEEVRFNFAAQSVLILVVSYMYTTRLIYQDSMASNNKLTKVPWHTTIQEAVDILHAQIHVLLGMKCALFAGYIGIS